MILCLGTTPAVQRVMFFDRLVVDEVNRATATLDGAAGKSINVAKVLHALGEPVVATGFLGGDRGRFLLEHLCSRGIAAEFVDVPVGTRQCVTVIDRTSGAVTELVEESQPVPAEAYGALEDKIRELIPRAKAVVMSGTIASGGPSDLYARCTRLAREASAFPVIDAKGEPLARSLEAKPALVKPNRSELAWSVGRKLQDDPALVRAMEEVHERGAERVVVTSGREATLAFDGRRFWRVRNPAIEVVNPIGSGDAVTAALTSRLLRGDDLGEACRWGAAAGVANALNPMAGEIDREGVARLLPEVLIETVQR